MTNDNANHIISNSSPDHDNMSNNSTDSNNGNFTISYLDYSQWRRSCRNASIGSTSTRWVLQVVAVLYSRLRLLVGVGGGVNHVCNFQTAVAANMKTQLDLNI